MIRSYRDRDAQRLMERKFSRRLQGIENSARVRLEVLVLNSVNTYLY